MAFRRIEIEHKSLYKEPSDIFHCSDNAVEGINAVWAALRVAGLGPIASESLYWKAYRALYGKAYCGDVLPAYLAKVMRGIGILLGFVFSDDVSTVVWPYGRHSSESGRDLVIYCEKVGLATRFSALRFLEAEGEPAIELSSRNRQMQLHLLDGKQLKSAQENTSRDQVEESPKRFPLFRLPAELRNKVHAFYISSLDFQHEGFRGGSWRKDIRVPELAQTCRQMRDEVLSMFLASKTILLHMKGYDLGHRGVQVVNSKILSDRIWALNSVPAAANFTRVDIITEDDEPGIDFKLRKSNHNYTLEVSDRWQNKYLPKLEVQYKQLHRLVKILVEDNTSYGLSLVDIAVVTKFVIDMYQKRIQ